MIFRVEKTKNFTILSNHCLRNKNLSLKAKGLLTQILSLPENWDYTLKGLSVINKESIDSIRSAVKELEAEGYLSFKRVRNEKGQLKGTEYTIREIPLKENLTENLTEKKLKDESNNFNSKKSNSPIFKKPVLEKPKLEKPILEKPMQINIDNNKNTYLLSTYQSIYQSIDKMNDKKPKLEKADLEYYMQTKEIVKKNISYRSFVNEPLDIDLVDEMTELAAEVICSEKDFYYFNNAKINADIVKARFLKLNHEHIEYVIYNLKKNCQKINNIRSYILTSLFNAPTTVDCFWQQKFQYDAANGIYNKGSDIFCTVMT